MKNVITNLVMFTGLFLGLFVGIASATPTPLEDAVTALTTTQAELLGQAATVIGLGLGLFVILFGVRWLVKLFKGTSR